MFGKFKEKMFKLIFLGIIVHVITLKAAFDITSQMDPTNNQSSANLLIAESEYVTKFFIRSTTIIGLVAWIFYVASFISIQTPRYTVSKSLLHFLDIFLFIPLYNISVIFFTQMQDFPEMYYIYFLFPVVMIQLLVKRYNYILEGLKLLKNYGIKSTVLSCFMYLCGLRVLVQTFSDREASCIPIYLLALSVLFSKSLYQHTNWIQKATWLITCLVLSIFSFFPAMSTSYSPMTYTFGYLVWWIAMRQVIVKQSEYPHFEPRRIEILIIQHTMLILTPLFTVAIEYRMIASDSYLKLLAFIWVLYPIFIIPCTSPYIFVRCSSIFLGFAPFFFLVAFNYEVIFLICYVIFLYIWLNIESKCFGYSSIYRTCFNEIFIPDANVTKDDVRRAFFFIVLIFVGFYGIGNTASLNSFHPMWTRSFLTVFGTYKMTAILILRNMVPLIYPTCMFRAINIFRKGSIFNMFCLISVFCDLMLLELLYSITNVEIETTLSHFIIMDCFVLILLMLYGFVYLLTTKTYTMSLSRIIYYIHLWRL